MTARKLSDRESAVLAVLNDDQHARTGGTPTGIFLAREMVNKGIDTSPSGAHRTAASLVRKGLARRAGTPKLQWYRITYEGRRALAGYSDGQWVASGELLADLTSRNDAHAKEAGT